MLEAMRKRAGTWVVRILSLFLILSFGVWGVGDMITARGVPDRIASVDGSEISGQEFSRQYRLALDQLRRALGPQVDEEQARRLGIVDRTIEGLVDARLIDLASNRMGLAVGEEQVRDRIFRDAAFKNQFNEFDPMRFRQILASSGLSESGYVDLLRSEMRQQYLMNAVGAGASLPSALVTALRHFSEDKRIAKIVHVPMPPPESIAEPSATDLATFYDENKALFMLPEFRRLVAIHLDPGDFTSEIAIPEDRLRDEYEARRSSLAVPEKRRLSQIVFPDEKTARKAFDLLGQGRPFEAVAEEHVGLKGSELSLGLVRRDDLPEPLAKAAFSLEGQIYTEPVQTRFGWHIVRVDAIEPGKTPSFEEMKDRIRDDLAREKAVDALVSLSNRLDDALAGGAGLEEAANELSVKLLRIDAVDAKGRDPGGAAVAGLPKDPAFLERAFDLAEGETSSLEETAGGGYFVVRVLSVIPPAVQPLGEIRDRAVLAWRSKQREQQAEAQARKFRDSVAGGASMDDAASQAGLTVRTSNPVTRFGDGDAKVPPTLLGELFRVKRGEVAMARVEGGYAVAEVIELKPADATPGEDALKELRERVQPAISGDLRQQFLAAIRSGSSVEIDQEAIDAIIAGGGPIRR